MNLRDKLNQFQDNQSFKNSSTRRKYKSRWVNSVNYLYSLITEEWLADLIEKKQLSANLREVSLYEAGVGEYKINKLELKFIPNHYIVFEPIAGFTLGGSGRIDLYKLGSVKNKVFLIRMDDTVDNINDWKIVYPSKRTEQISFGKESFEKLLNSWL